MPTSHDTMYMINEPPLHPNHNWLLNFCPQIGHFKRWFLLLEPFQPSRVWQILFHHTQHLHLSTLSVVYLGMVLEGVGKRKVKGRGCREWDKGVEDPTAEGEPSKFPNCLLHSPRSASRTFRGPAPSSMMKATTMVSLCCSPIACKEVPARPCISTCIPTPMMCTHRRAPCAVRNDDGIVVIAMIHPLTHHHPVALPTPLPIQIAMHRTGTYSTDDVVAPAYPHQHPPPSPYPPKLAPSIPALVTPSTYP